MNSKYSYYKHGFIPIDASKTVNKMKVSKKIKNLIYIIIGILIIFNILKPEFIKINKQEAQRCFIDGGMICD